MEETQRRSKTVIIVSGDSRRQDSAEKKLLMTKAALELSVKERFEGVHFLHVSIHCNGSHADSEPYAVY